MVNEEPLAALEGLQSFSGDAPKVNVVLSVLPLRSRISEDVDIIII